MSDAWKSVISGKGLVLLCYEICHALQDTDDFFVQERSSSLETLQAEIRLDSREAPHAMQALSGHSFMQTKDSIFCAILPKLVLSLVSYTLKCNTAGLMSFLNRASNDRGKSL